MPDNNNPEIENEIPDAPKTLGLSHLGLAVSKLEESAAFFVEGMSWKEVRRKPEYPAIFVSDGSLMLTLWQADADAAPFDRRAAVGLHHVAIKVASEEVLTTLVVSLSAREGVVLEFAPESIGEGPAKHAMMRDPSGLRIELFYAP